MKILVVSQYYYPEPFRITDICETLVSRGHSVTVLTGQPNYPEGKIYEGYKNYYMSENINGVSVYRTKIHPRKKGNLHLLLNYISFPLYANRTLKRIDNDFDVVFINQLSPIISALPGLKYAKRHKVKSYLYCLDLWPESLKSGGIKSNSLIYKVFGIVSKHIYKKCNKVLVTSKSFIDKFKEFNIEVEYLPQYAEDVFVKIPEHVKEYNKFYCTFAGNIGEMQSVETILYAAKELIEQKDIIINIYGNGSRFDYIKSLKQTLELDNVVLHGRKDISEMPTVYAKSDALIITMKNDSLLSMTLPGKVQTYLAAGKPIIGSIGGEARLVINESGAGYVCDPEDAIGLSELIKKAKDNPHITNFGYLGRKFYDENYNKRAFFTKLEKLLNEE